MRKLSCLFALVLFAAIAVAATPAIAPLGTVVQVNGGGTGLFIDPSITPTDMGLTTNFSVGLKVNSDGSGTGHFTCLIPAIVVINGQYDAASYDSDTGIVTASGTAVIYFPQFDPIEVDFTNTFKAGGPGVGVFTLSETSGYFPNYPDDVDTEVVIRGMINIH